MSTIALQRQWIRHSHVVLKGSLGLPFLMALALWWRLRVPLLAGESPCYIQWCPKLTSVYPTLVNALDQSALLPVQLTAFAITISVLVWVVYRASDSALPALVLMLGLIANPFLWQLQGSIMSEALTTPLLIAMLAAVVVYLQKDNVGALLAAALAAGVIGAARPSDLPVVLLPLMAAALSPASHLRRKGFLSLGVVAIWFAPVAVDKAFTTWSLGAQKTSLTGRHVIGKATIIDAQPLDRSLLSPLEVRIADVVEKEFAPIRQTIQRAPPGTVRDLVRFNYEVCVQFACTDSQVGLLSVPRPTLDAALIKIGLARLRQQPLEYIKLVFAEYRGLWLLHPRKHPCIAPKYNAFLEIQGRLPFQELLEVEGHPVPESEQLPLYRVTRAVFLAFGIATHALLICLAWLCLRGSRDRPLLASLASLTAGLACLGFIACVGVGIPRYTMGMWPLLIFAYAGLIQTALSATERNTPRNQERRTHSLA